jgi:exopolyphosphatase/guanosine-5'-triphosphate,3'-diphosphate pyrophosphatase
VPEVVAVIDCGSNSTRLLVAGPEGARAREMRITRLSAGVDATGRLTPDALARTFAVIEEYAALARDLGVEAGLVVATSAVRDAANALEFLAGARERSGLAAQVLTGAQEAAYSYAGAVADLAASDAATVVIDVGGGSTELAGEFDGALQSCSMQLGCVRVTERALGADVVDEPHARAARAMIDAELDRVAREVPELFALERVRLVGLAGTVSTLAQLDAGEATYRRESVHHRLLSRASVVAWRDRLGAEPPAERLARPGMVAGREDVIVAGLYVLEAAMGRLGASELLTSESDILDGVAEALRRAEASPATMGG